MNGRKNILVTGAAGFIGANLVLRLLESEEPLRIVGLDNLNDYYDPSLKEYRLRLIEEKVRQLADPSAQSSQTEAAQTSQAGNQAEPCQAAQSGQAEADQPCQPGQSAQSGQAETDQVGSQFGNQTTAGQAGLVGNQVGEGSQAAGNPQEAPMATAPKHQWRFVKGSIADKELVDGLFEEEKFDIVVNLAAQAGVRYSIENPGVYMESNVIGFYNILEACRHSRDIGLGSPGDPYDVIPGSTGNPYRGVQHLVYASSSSVYGGNKKVPFSVDDRVDNPMSLYAATKKSNELMAYCYSKLYSIPTTGLRFFTVYGPAGRPDMAYFGFTDKLLRGQTIRIFNYGNCRRDFTYVDDIVEGVVRVMGRAPKGGEISPLASLGRNDTVPYAIYNIGGGQPENLLDFVTILQEELVRAGVLPADYDFEAHKELVPMQPGDVPTTYADASALERDFGFTPKIPLREGLRKFAQWYKEYYLPDGKN